MKALARCEVLEQKVLRLEQALEDKTSRLDRALKAAGEAANKAGQNHTQVQHW